MKMIYIAVALIIAISANAQKTGFEIIGELKGLKNNTWLYLIHNKDQHGPDTVSRIQSKGQKFAFRGVAPFDGEAYFIKIDTIKTKYETTVKGYITLIIENKRIEIKGSMEHLRLEDVSITGSQSHDDYVIYAKGQKEAMNRENQAANRLYNIAIPTKDSATIQRYQDIYDSLKKATNAFYLNWISQCPNSTLTPWIISASIRDISKKAEAFNKLGPVAKQSKYGQLLKMEIDRDNKTVAGVRCPDFAFPTPQGANLSLQSEVSKAKVTVVDFWASWCSPCVKSIPDLKQLYEKYHEKGLNIISYSVDEKEGDWKKAISKYHITWANVRETIKDFATNNYNVTSLPHTLLLDSEGKVIAKGLIGEDLQKKVEELIGNEDK